MFDFIKLPSMAEEAGDTTEADEKAERIQFHREKVRNGPAKFSAPTNGQLRRSEKRAGQRGLTQRRREQVRTYFAREREAAVIRGNLQALAIFDSEASYTEEQIERAARWVVQHYGNIALDDSELLRDAAQKAFDRFCDLTGRERSTIEYTA